MNRMLLVFAHPNDETYAVGGTVSKYVRAGWQVDLVVAGHNFSGETMNYDDKGNPVVHDPQVLAAAKELGIASVKLLGYKEGDLSLETPGEIEDKLYKVIEEKLPHVVVTFDPSGISNHPDHAKISLSTTYVFQKYVKSLLDLKKKPKIYGKHEEEWFATLEKMINARVDPKLYYVCMPDSMVTFAKKSGAIPSESYGKPWVGNPDKKVTHVIDTSAFKAQKAKALLCYLGDSGAEANSTESSDLPVLEQEFFVQRYEGLTEIFMGKNDQVQTEL